jgi:hypothetical protein
VAPSVPIVGLSNLLVSCRERSLTGVLQTRPSSIGLQRTPSLASHSYRVRFESCFLGKDAKVEGDPKAALGESSEPYVTA